MAFDGSTIGAATTGTFVGTTYTDTFISGFSDVDMVALTLNEGRRYLVDVDNGLDFYLRIFDVFGNEVAFNDDGNRSAAGDNIVNPLSPFIEFIPNHSGTYYVAVSPYYVQDYNPFSTAGRIVPENPLASSTGTLVVTDVLDDRYPSAGSIQSILGENLFTDVSDHFPEGGRIRVEFSGSIDSPTDVDITRIDLHKADVLVIDVNGLTGNGTVVRVFDAFGTQLAFDDNSGTGFDSELVFSAPSLSSFFFAISGDGNSTYNGLDGTGTTPGTTGNLEIIFHLNPTLIGTGSSQATAGASGEDYIVGLAGNDTLSGLDGNDTLAGGG